MSETRLVAYSNDAFALVAASFNFSIYNIVIQTKALESVAEVLTTQKYTHKMHQSSVLKIANPKDLYALLIERMVGVPKDFSWKISRVNCIFEDEEDIQKLEFKRVTLHKSHSTEPDYHDYVLNKSKGIWDLCKEYYLKNTDMTLKNFSPSILLLLKIDGEEKKATDEITLIKILTRLYSTKNPLSIQMFDLVSRIQKKRNIWEYLPIN